MDTSPADLGVCHRNTPGHGYDLSAVVVRFSRSGGGGNTWCAGPHARSPLHGPAGAHGIASGASGWSVADFLPTHYACRDCASPDVATRGRDRVCGGICRGQRLVRFITGVSNSLATECLYHVHLFRSVSWRTTAHTVFQHGSAALGAVQSTDSSISMDTAACSPTLVSSASMACPVLRESVTSLTVIWLLNIGEYLPALT